MIIGGSLRFFPSDSKTSSACMPSGVRQSTDAIDDVRSFADDVNGRRFGAVAPLPLVRSIATPVGGVDTARRGRWATA